MKTINFELEAEYIELIKILKYLQLAETGGHAKQMVDSGLVILNGEIENRKRAKLRKGDRLKVFDTEILIK
jgi:ribosome-associated protein